VVLLSAAASLAACATSEYRGRVLTPQDEASMRAHAHGADLEATIVENDRPARHGPLVLVRPDESLVRLPAGESPFPNAAIHAVRVKNHWRGALEGAGMGLGAGALGGAALGFVSCASDRDGCGGEGLFLPLAGAVGGAAVGLVVGAIAGALHGHVTRYWFGSFRP